MAAKSDDRIVVGIDGSEPSVEALRWAAEQARLTNSRLEVVIAWEIPASFGMETLGGFSPSYEGLPPFDFAGTAQLTLDTAVKEAIGAPGGLHVDRLVIEGHPAAVLLDRSIGAQLLVVGSRGHGGFEGLVFGSVSAHVAGHAHCPVTVVRNVDSTPSQV
jgi:nucleotide-binding universal stress UspA family protein